MSVAIARESSFRDQVVLDSRTESFWQKGSSMSKNEKEGRGRNAIRYLAPRVLAITFSILFVVVVGEVALRLVPQLLPKGHYGSGRFDEELRLKVHGSPAIYNKVRFVRRAPNAAGFMDIDHETPKPDGTTRVGFFGDSYVESLQVPFSQTFFARLEQDLHRERVETYSLGISGWGTLHSLLAYQALANEHDLDIAVYVFVENDPGDNSYAIRGAQKRGQTPSPSAVLKDSPPGFDIRWPTDPADLPLSYRIGKWIQNRSLLAKLLNSRLQLIAKQGARPANESPGKLDPGRSRAVNQNDLPSTWPPSLLAEAKELTERILGEFVSSVRRDGRKVFVLYVPRGTNEVNGTLPENDRWLPWLTTVTERLEVELLDPTTALRKRQATGRPVYDDHWSPDGHEVIARFLVDIFCARLAEIECARPDPTSEN
jgi:hypothetical protein